MVRNIPWSEIQLHYDLPKATAVSYGPLFRFPLSVSDSGNAAGMSMLPDRINHGDNRIKAVRNKREAGGNLHIEDCRDDGNSVPVKIGREFVDIETAQAGEQPRGTVLTNTLCGSR
jgi:hypothetical protein